MTTLEQLFERADRVPTFEQVFGTKEPRRLPTVCCVTGDRIRKGANWQRHALGNGFSVFALRPLTDERKTALTALLSAQKVSKAKDTTNG
jgi:hypothetical protein